jgi:hypothetical protein
MVQLFFAETLTTQPPSELDVLAVCASAVAHCIAVPFDDFQKIWISTAKAVIGPGFQYYDPAILFPLRLTIDLLP